MSISASTPEARTYSGVYAAKVASASDPLSQGRVRMWVPQIFGATPLQAWAPPLVPSQLPPNVGQMVWCLFQGGDPAFPTYLPPWPVPALGVPPGGQTGYVLTKDSATDWDVDWWRPLAGLSGGRAELGGINVTNSGGWAEIHTNMRMTVTVGASGVVDVFYQIQGVTASAGIDISVGGNVDGGAWNLVAGYPFTAAANQPVNVFGARQWIGLTPGSHTFSTGWAVTGAGTLTIGGAGRGPCQHTATICFPR